MVDGRESGSGRPELERAVREEAQSAEIGKISSLGMRLSVSSLGT